MVASTGCILLSACGSGSPSILDPRGPGAARIATLWWFMFAVSAFVVLLVTVLIVVGVLPWRRRRPDSSQATPTWAKVTVTGGGVVFPIIILTILWVWTLSAMRANSEAPGSAPVDVVVTGYQWWWEVQYPAYGITTANDIHIPTGRAVRVTIKTFDVNHSLWVPQLTGKTDLIAGRVTRTWWVADRPGIYRGQCAEYCGLQHANMIFYVVAQSPAAFQGWVSQERQPAGTPTASNLFHGQQVFLTSPCVACHTITGVSTAAPGTPLEQFGLNLPTTAVLGPDLTHFGSRISIGAGAVRNTPGNLGGWIVDSQGIKPGNRMPRIELPAQDLQDLIDYLESLE